MKGGAAADPRSTHGVAMEGDVVVKRYASADRGEPQREWTSLQVLAQHQPGLAPEPLELTGPPWVLRMSRLRGTPHPRREPLTTEQLTHLGVAFERLWSVPVTAIPDLSARIMAAPATSDLVTALLDRGGEPVEPSCRDALDEFRAWFTAAGRDQLARPCPTPVFSRGDQNLDNILWDGAQVRLVDFEDAGLSCQSYDLADVTEHIGSRATPEAMWQSFAASHGDGCRDLFVAARRLLACWWLLALLPGGVGRHRNPPGSDVLQAQRLLGLLRHA
ncbi:MAG: hypothetical protein QOE05_1865 [Actinomycetota bacterium]|jgi:hypothetical protein|nr:hypothetical protein [Actinomycetota bacterium]